MNRINFKISVIALAIGMCMVSCDGGNSNKQNGGKKTDVETAKELVGKADDKSVTADNWQSVVKKEFGIDFAVPAGWTFKQVNALDFSETIITLLIRFEKTDDNAVQVSETAKTLFDKTKTLSSEGIFLIDVSNNSSVTKKGQTFATFDERFKPSMMYDGVSDIETYWYYKISDVIKMVDVSAEKGRMTVKLELNKAIKL
jgi:hypothetical protein